MVCLGNICRSPLAEGILQKKAREAGLNWTIESAGTNGYHTGEAPHHLSQKVAKRNGIDISSQPGCNKNVPDPWFGEEDGYTEVYELIDKACDAIIKNYLTNISKTQIT